MKTLVLEIDKLNKNGRIYPRDCVERAVARASTVTIFRHLAEDDLPPAVGDPVGTATLTIEGSIVFGDCTFSIDDVEEQINAGKLFVRTRGTGSVDAKGVVQSDYKIVSLLLTNDPA
jgi:hypothetical protein